MSIRFLSIPYQPLNDRSYENVHYNILHPSAFLSKKQRIKDINYMKHFYQYLRLLLWRVLDAIDRKLGPGPGDHRL